jgi:ribosomal-protein-alanine N-acetyltransferase
MVDQISIPGSGITILTTTWRDLRDVHLLEQACFELDAWPILDILGVLTFPQILRYKAMDSDKMIGFIAVDLRRGQNTAWIATLAVLPQYRKMGIGSALLTLCEDQVDLERIRLSVRESNHAAKQLYRKHGYSHIDTWKKYYRGGDDALVFEKYLSRSPSSLANLS